MPVQVQTVPYFRVRTPDRPGTGAKLLEALRAQRVALRAVHAFPRGRGAQVDLVAVDPAALRRAARRARLRLAPAKRAFLIEGDDRTGVLAGPLASLAAAGIGVTAMSAVRAGAGRFGAILWVAQRDLRRAAKALGARAR
jgi:hypothetical protein